MFQIKGCRSGVFRAAIGIMILTALLLAGGGARAQVIVSSCPYNISQPGEYVLTQDIISSTAPVCINIMSSNVIFDGNGHTIDGWVGGINTQGVYVYNSTNVTVKNLNVTDWFYGILLSDSINSAVIGNTVSNNRGEGIYLYTSSNIRVIGNTVSNNDWGIALYSSYLSLPANNTLINNVMTGNRFNFGVTGYADLHFNNSIDTSNTVDGKPILYIKNGKDTVYDSSSNAGIVYCYWCNNVTFRNLALLKNKDGISLWKTSNSKVENINASNNWNGITIDSSSNIMVLGNTALNNSNGYGSNGYGILISYSSNNTVSGNTASNNDNGIWLISSGNNTVSSNTASNNTKDGIYLLASSNNTINNNIFNNANNFIVYSTIINTWNIAKTPGTNIIGGPYLGGNFWGYPNGTGFSQKCTDVGGDGLCDSPYTLDANNIDYLPLAAAPIGPTQVTACRDITSPGEYVLTADIINSNVSTCISIRSDDVIFDGNGHTIDGIDVWNTYGVSVFALNLTGPLTNITVKNVNLTDWTNGIYFDNNIQGVIINNTVYSNHRGIYFSSSFNNILTDNNADSNIYGIYLSSSSNNTLNDNNVSNNVYGIYLFSSSNNTLRGNAANSTYDNDGGGDGIYLYNSNNNILDGNNANFNFNWGIGLYNSSNNILTNNNALGNSYWDFYSGSNSINNTVTDLVINPMISFTGKDVAIISSASPPGDPFGYRNIGKYVDATNTSADSWLFLNVSYSDSDVTGLNENTLRMWRYSGSWSRVSETNGVDTAQNHVYANITSFGIFAPLAEATNPYTFQTTGNATQITVDGTPQNSPYTAIWADGTIHNISVPAGQPIVPGQSQYVFTTWSEMSTSNSPAISIIASANATGTYNANYKTQYYLTVNTSPAGLTPISGEGWYDSGTNATTGIAPGTVGTYTFNTWEVDGSPVSGNPVTVTMNAARTATAVYLQENTPPVTTILLSGSAGNNGWNISDVTVTLTATDSGSGVNRTEYNITGNWVTYDVPFNITVEGITAIQYHSVDNAGNIESVKTETVRIDKTAPASINITDLLNISYATNYINWTWNDPDDADFDHVEVYINENFKENVKAGMQYYNAEGLIPDTRNTIATRTVDIAGNVNQTWVNHTANTAIPVPPIIVTITSPENNSYNTTGNVNVTVSLDRPATEAFLNWEGVNESMEPVDGSNLSFYGNKTGLISGNFRFRVYASDSRGISNVSETRIVTVNRTIINDSIKYFINSSTFIVNATLNYTAPSGNVNFSIYNGTKASLNNAALTYISMDSMAELNQTIVKSLTDYRFAGENLSIGPDGALFKPDVQIRFNYTDEQLEALGLTDSNLTVKYFNETTNLWEDANITAHDTIANYIIVNTSHFSMYVLAVPASGHISPSGGYSGGGGGGGAGTGVISKEPPENIEKFETKKNNVARDIPVSYKFTPEEGGIYEIVVTGKKTEDNVYIRVEHLKNLSKLLKEPAPEMVYYYVNVWSGTEDIKDAFIRFKVENSWIASNRPANGNMKMLKWDGSKWITLDTVEKAKDATHTYYEAKSNSLSQLAVIGEKAANVTATPATPEIKSQMEAVTPLPAASPVQSGVTPVAAQEGGEPVSPARIFYLLSVIATASVILNIILVLYLRVYLRKIISENMKELKK